MVIQDIFIKRHGTRNPTEKANPAIERFVEAPGATLHIPTSLLYPNLPKSNFRELSGSEPTSNTVGEMMMKDKNHVKQQIKTILQGVIKQSLRQEDVSRSFINPFNLKTKLFSFFAV